MAPDDPVDPVVGGGGELPDNAPDAVKIAREERKEQFAHFVKPRHYYGNIVRVLFLIAGAILLAVPLLGHLSVGATALLVIVILVLGILAGATNPKLRWTMGANVLVSAVALVVSELVAVIAYHTSTFSVAFILWQALSIIFFFALYYAVKTFRGRVR